MSPAPLLVSGGIRFWVAWPVVARPLVLEGEFRGCLGNSESWQWEGKNLLFDVAFQNGIQTNKPALRAVRQRSEFTLMAK